MICKQKDNLEEMDQFLETYKISRLSQEESENLNKLITCKKVEEVIKLPIHKSPQLDGFTCDFYQN